jgi:DNA-binding NtrC family response regulator
MPPASKILVVDDEPGILRYLRTSLELNPYQVRTAASGQEALQLVQQGFDPEVVILDLLMPGLDGLETLQRLKTIRPKTKVIMLSCVSDTQKVVQAIRLGAYDYLTKPFQKSDLDAILAKCFALGQQSIDDGNDIEELGDDLFFLASSPSMRQIRQQAKVVAAVDVPVLILGESGSGKEILARLIQKSSKRANKTFIKVNCAAVPANLLESELFGYEAGAFTGATKAKPGKFELCEGGTILLDEIGEMPPELQAKLLHILQDHTYSRLGGRTTLKADVRILAATNINIDEAIQQKKLREDLYYRLNAFVLRVPPLRERKEAIPMLLRTYMNRTAEQFAKAPLPISQAMVDACMRYHWPGNLRELANFVKRYLVMGDESIAMSELQLGRTEPEPLSAAVAAASSNTAAIAAGAQHRGDLKSLARSVKFDAEGQAIARALEETGWNRKKAAVILNISYKALLYKIRQYNLQ